MFKKLTESFSIIIPLFFMVMVSNSFASEDWKAEIEEKLKKIYTLSETPLFGEGLTPGTILKVKKVGLLSSPKAIAGPFMNYITKGKVQQPEISFLSRDAVLKGLGVGEQFCVTGIHVYDNEILFAVSSVELRDTVVDTRTVHSYDRASLIFQFSNSPYSFSEAKKEIDTFFTLDGADSEPKELSIGQSIEQVKEILGDPEKIFNLGKKKIYSYKDLKVTFIDEKVSDIQ